jgi:hypothetical protein
VAILRGSLAGSGAREVDVVGGGLQEHEGCDRVTWKHVVCVLCALTGVTYRR